MTARLIVDGNNLMGSRPDGWWRDRTRATRRLIGLLGAWAASREEDVLVVFDGSPPAQLDAIERVEVRFAQRRGADAADDVIAALVAADGAPASLQVVTSDAALAARVRSHGAGVIGAGSFRNQLDDA